MHKPRGLLKHLPMNEAAFLAQIAQVHRSGMENPQPGKDSGSGYNDSFHTDHAQSWHPSLWTRVEL